MRSIIRNEKPIIECKDLIHIYGDSKENVVLKGISLNILPGEKVAIMGKSGSGKTTLLSIIGSLIKPTGGVVVVNGTNLSKLSLNEVLEFRRNEIGFIFQKDNAIDFLTVEENIALPLKFEEKEPDLIKKRVEFLSNKLDIKRYLSKYPEQLSGGELQRLGIAIALANNPFIILADEPTGSIDIDTAKLVYEFLTEICNQFGTTLVIVTHDLAVKDYVDRIIDLNKLNQNINLTR